MASNQEDKEKDKQEFIREHIKAKPLNKKRVLLYMGLAVLLGILFGASVFFTERFLVNTLSKEGAATEEEPEEEASADAQKEESEEEAGEPEVIVEQKSLELSDYQFLQNELYDVGQDANHSIVTVSLVSRGTDPFGSAYEDEDQNMGLVISKDDSQIQILTQNITLKKGQRIQVTFEDGHNQEGQLLSGDSVTGFCIINVPTEGMEEETLSQLETAVFNRASTVSQGQIVVAAGSPLGTIYSVLDGTVTSVNNHISLEDGNFTIYTTTMIGSENGSGILLDTNGKVIGIMRMEYNNESDRNTLTAIAISDLYPTIEKLAKGEEIAYLGLNISTITASMAEEYSIPQGVYVRSVSENTPALMAGIQAGDVITKMGSDEIKTTSDFRSHLLKMSDGSTETIQVMRSGNGEYTEIGCTVTYGTKK
jgi:serine protease Do